MDEHCNEKISEALKELGYPTKVTFVNHFGAIEIPVNQGYIHLWDAQKWLREEKKIEVVVLSRGMIGKPYYYQVYKEDSIRIDDKNYDSYEEALLEGTKEAVKILKENE